MILRNYLLFIILLKLAYNIWSRHNYNTIILCVLSEVARGMNVDTIYDAIILHKMYDIF